MSHNDFLKIYTREQSHWQDYVRRLVNLIEDLLKSKSIDFHVIEGRAKTVESVREKLNRPGKSYTNPAKNLPDLAGIRIVLYDKEGVDNAAQLIDAEFSVDEASSTDKSKELSPDQFGYLSFHKIISLPGSRLAMTEWSRFSEMHAEVQIRTVLQHAWASISHKMQYKRESEIPAVLRRRLMRLAGLFELADDEFLALRAVDRETRDSIAEKINQKNPTIPLDLVSISTWLPQSKYWEMIEQALDPSKNDIIDSAGLEFDGFDQLFDVTQKIGYKTIDDLDPSIETAVIKGNEFFKELNYPMLGDRAHFTATLLIASNLHVFSDQQDWPDRKSVV